MPGDFRPCALIPTFDNPATVGSVVDRVQRHVRDVIVVDDGSGTPAHRVLGALAQREGVHLLRREQNGGKGRAVKDGLELAREQGFTHALQVDADGQHTINDAAELLRVAENRPDALVLGDPQFDDSVPRARLLGRQLTRFWTRVETRGPVISDPMCGFRVYPIEAALSAAARGDRMDFDPEIAVRMVWNGTPVEHVPTRVRYLSKSEGGVSHFHLLRDNLLIAWMHTRLVCALLFGRAFRTRRRLRWDEQPEAGNALGVRIVAWTARLLGRRAARALLLPIVTYYALFARRARRASSRYLERVGTFSGFWSVHRHFLRFAQCALDRWFLLSGQLDSFRFTTHGVEHLLRLRERKQGALLVGAHIGSFEAGRALSRDAGLRVHALGRFDARRRINLVLDRAGDNRAGVVELDPDDPSYLFRIKELIDRGELVALLGDRLFRERGVAVDFLGGEARFPIGPYAIASALGCPVLFTLALHFPPNRYELYCEPIAERVPRRRDDPEAFAHCAQMFARRLEHYCRLAPDNWFNFYDFWAEQAE